MTKRTTAICGSGTMGTALAHAIAEAGHPCLLWCPEPVVAAAINETRRHPVHFVGRELHHGVRATSDLRAALETAQAAIVAVRSETFRSTVTKFRGLVRDNVPIFSATKGVEAGTAARMSTVIREVLGTGAVGAIAGANLAYDIIADRPTALVIASASSMVREIGADLLDFGRRRVMTSPDLHGVELVGVLKNVIALAVGIAGGLGLGDNARALIFAQGLQEISRLALRLGAHAGTVSGVATVGDLFLTTTSETSRNHLAGVELGRGMPLPDLVRMLADLQEVAEGLESARVARGLAAAERMPLPIIEAVDDIVSSARTPRLVFDRLLEDAALYRTGAIA